MKPLQLTKKIILAISIIQLHAILHAHPHVFIENSAIFVFDKKELVGMKIIWKFDDMFSSSIIHDFDKDKNGIFNKSEMAALEDGAFSNLRDYNYFLHVKINGKTKKVTSVDNFKAYINNKSTIIYTFFVPLNVNRETKKQKIVFSVYDRTYYSSVQYAKKNPLGVKGLSQKNCSYRIINNSDKLYYNEQISPEEIHFNFWN